jgi:two-component system, LytTR family, response regulator
MSLLSPSLLVVAETPADGEEICRLIGDDPAMEILGLWNGHEPVRDLVTTLRPDILILGVDLKRECGFGLLQEFGGPVKPLVIFVSANRAHAVEAFRFHPLDFLVSPVDEIRLRETIERAKLLFRQERGEEGNNQTRLPGQSKRLMVKSAGRILFLAPEEIDWIAAERDYVCIHNSGKKHLIREKISDMERHLPGDRFLRIHRSTIVNIERIRELQPLCYGEYAVVLRDGTRLVLSRSYKGRVLHRLTTAA